MEYDHSGSNAARNERVATDVRMGEKKAKRAATALRLVRSTRNPNIVPPRAWPPERELTLRQDGDSLGCIGDDEGKGS